MPEPNWKRLKESTVMGYGGVLPARVVLERNEADHSYRTVLETISGDGKPGFQRARYFYCEEEALEDYKERLGR
jgi:hypothetical protein